MSFKHHIIHALTVMVVLLALLSVNDSELFFPQLQYDHV